MKPSIPTVLLGIALMMSGVSHSQVITQLGRENMRIPTTERPDADTPIPAVRPHQVNVDTTSVYYQHADSAQRCIHSHDWPGAERHILAAIATEPENTSNSLLLSNLGTIQRYQGKLDESLKSYNMALDLTPNAVTLLLNRAALLLQMGLTPQAVDDFQRVRTLDATEVESRYSLGMLAVEQHDFEEAKTLFDEIFAFSPRSSLGNEGMGLLYKEQGDYDRAIDRLSMVIDDHADSRLLANRADCLMMKRRLNEASEDIHQAIELDPDDGYLYVLRAKLNRMRWNLEDAERDIELAVNHGIDREVVQKLLK